MTQEYADKNVCDTRRRRHWRRLGATVAVCFIFLAAAANAVVANGVHVGPVDRPSLAELNTIVHKLDQSCAEARVWRGNNVDVFRGRVRGVRTSDGLLTERERSLVDETGNCHPAAIT